MALWDLEIVGQLQIVGKVKGMRCGHISTDDYFQSVAISGIDLLTHGCLSRGDNTYPKHLKKFMASAFPGCHPPPMNSARTLRAVDISTDLPIVRGRWVKLGSHSLELDLHSSRRLDDSSRNNKDDRKGKTEKDNTNASEGRPACNGSTSQSNCDDVENCIPPLGNCKCRSASLQLSIT